MNLSESQIKTIFSKGVKKAKSLIAIHVSGNNMNVESVMFIRDILKIITEEKREIPVINQIHENIGQQAVLDDIIEMRFFTHQVKHKLKFHEDVIIAPREEINQFDHYTYIRYLGVQEMVEGHKWQEVNDKECYVCRKDQYCLFFWSKSLAQSHYYNQRDSLPIDISKVFKKQPTDEVWLSI